MFQTQLTSRFQEDKSKRRSLSVMSDRSQCSRSPAGDPVLSATLQQLQQLGVNVEEEALTELDRTRVRVLENSRYRNEPNTLIMAVINFLKTIVLEHVP